MLEIFSDESVKNWSEMKNEEQCNLYSFYLSFALHFNTYKNYLLREHPENNLEAFPCHVLHYEAHLLNSLLLYTLFWHIFKNTIRLLANA